MNSRATFPRDLDAASPLSCSEEHIVILLATYNGSPLLAPQLESLSRQTHRNWSLLVSDDGSQDQTTDIIRDFAANRPGNRITILDGPGHGSAQNFLSLLRAAGNASFVAFCDQDDVWFDNKLARAMACLGQSTKPAIYGSATLITDQSLKPLRHSLRFRRPPGFQNALVQNIAGGNTMVINRKALDVLQPASHLAGQIVAHDWWCYQMVTGMGGDMLYDPSPGLFYRQHAANQIGANDTLAAKISRLRRLARRDFARSLHAHFEALEHAKDYLTPEARRTLSSCNGLNSRHILARMSALRASGIYRQTRCGSLALHAATLTGRL